MRVRWALEEVGQAYQVKLVTFDEMKEPEHLRIQPFGQIPTYEEGELRLFESGAIVLHVAEQGAGLLPFDADARSRAIAWMFAALNSGTAFGGNGSGPADGERQALVRPALAADGRAGSRPLEELVVALGDAQWLDGDFSAGDLMMIGVLFRTKELGLLASYRT